MALLTTTIGTYPKPDYIPTPDWFREREAGLSNPTEAYQKYLTIMVSDAKSVGDKNR